MIAELVYDYRIKIAISANWRYVIPSDVLDLFPSGILNLHVGRLPDYKGNATANWAILAGEPEIFADVHFMIEELDAGNVLARKALQLNESTYIGDVMDWVQAQAPHLFLAALDSALSDPGRFVVPGSTGGLRCYPRLPQDGNIDWAQSAAQVARLVRASSRPYPGAFSWHRGQQIKVWRASVARLCQLVPGRAGSSPEIRSQLRHSRCGVRIGRTAFGGDRGGRAFGRSGRSDPQRPLASRAPSPGPARAGSAVQPAAGPSPHNLKIESASA